MLKGAGEEELELPPGDCGHGQVDLPVSREGRAVWAVVLRALRDKRLYFV
jgi:hypothetical protein